MDFEGLKEVALIRKGLEFLWSMCMRISFWEPVPQTHVVDRLVILAQSYSFPKCSKEGCSGLRARGGGGFPCACQGKRQSSSEASASPYYPWVLLVVTCCYQRVYEFLNGSFQTKVSVFLLEPAAYRLHPKCKGVGEILRASNFTLAIRSQRIALNAATSFNHGM